MRDRNLFKNFFIISTLIICVFGFIFIPSITKAEGNVTCAVYFTGVGCTHCAKTDPVVLGDLLKKYPNLVIIEYEIYQQKENAPLLSEYNENYGSGLGIPLIILGFDKYIAGDRPILENIFHLIQNLPGNYCPLIDGNSLSFEELDLTMLPGGPKIWTDDRILIKEGGNKWKFAWNGRRVQKRSSENIANHKDVLQELIKTDNISGTVSKINYNSIQPMAVALSGKNINFDNTIEFIASQEEPAVSLAEQTFTLPKILSLAAVDAVNPCALAVLALMLIAILTYNPKNKRNVLLAGLAFVSSVFVMYLIYGLVIIKFFQLVQALTIIRLWLYKVLGGVAIILGILNIKDFIKYKTGGLGTEMPMFLRPRVKKIISGITSPRGALVVGAFVTIFLLPCTIGPYIICGGILCPFGLLKSLPWLLFYNLIFVLPMLVITALVYLGIARVHDVSGWKDKNIRYLHLIAGLVILGLGVAMVLGLV